MLARPPVTPCILFLFVKPRFCYCFFSPTCHHVKLASCYGIHRQLRSLGNFTPALEHAVIQKKSAGENLQQIIKNKFIVYYLIVHQEDIVQPNFRLLFQVFQLKFWMNLLLQLVHQYTIVTLKLPYDHSLLLINHKDH